MSAYQFLLLLKPEASRPLVDRHGLLRMLHEHLELHEVSVLAQRTLSGPQLHGLRALDALYLRLSVISRVGESALTMSERAALVGEAPNLRRSAADYALLEFGCSPRALCAEGDGGKVQKLGPGAYAARIDARGCIVLNHFFPEFRERFYAEGAVVTAFECQASKIELHALRDILVGHVRPELALTHSLRASALARAGELRLGTVSIARNFFHISPGYLEAACQLAHLFPERGTLRDRLVDDGIVSAVSGLLEDQDPLILATLFAETEPMARQEASHALERWSHELTR